MTDNGRGFHRRGSRSFVTFLAEPLLTSLAATTPVDLLGAAGVASGCLWGLFRSRRTILLVQSAGAVSFALHYMLLGSAAGAAACFVGMVQSLAALRLSGRPLAAAFGLTGLAAAAAACLTWNGIPSLCAALGTSFACAGRLQRNPQRMRLLFFACSSAWVGHNALTGSVFGLTSDALTLTGLGLGLWRHRARRRAVPAVQPVAPPPAPANDRSVRRAA
jgi:inner membrane protein